MKTKKDKAYWLHKEVSYAYWLGYDGEVYITKYVNFYNLRIRRWEILLPCGEVYTVHTLAKLLSIYRENRDYFNEFRQQLLAEELLD